MTAEYVELELADGRIARVLWVNGPPYLSVSYRGKKRAPGQTEPERTADHAEPDPDLQAG